MADCNNLLHPFQTDPGTSQHQRVADALLSDAPPVDGRKLADLLDYFVQLSRHVNYYDAALQISDWQPFFQKSTPFVLATILKYNHENITDKFDLYNKLFDKNPSAQSIRLLLHYIFYNTIQRINKWHQHLEGSDLPVVAVTEKLIKDKLADPLKLFIKYANTAAKHFPVKKIDFQALQSNEVWNLTTQDLVAIDDDFLSSGTTQRKRLIALRNNIRDLLPAFINVIKSVATTAELNIEQSLFPLKQELQKQHTPHLGLLFAFLKLFQHLQADLNSFTRKHLDFFYTEVLKMKPRGADADRVHIVFEIQNQLDKYLLKKGLQVKDGKDLNKAEVFFALDDEIVVSKAQVSDVRTLFLNNQSVYRKDFVQGIYMAPDARKADGVKLPFAGSGLNSWPTVGARWSKYTDPELKTIKPYPAARTGFILASPVLLLNEGTRTIEVNLACRINDLCRALGIDAPGRTKKDCCGNTEPVKPVPAGCEEKQNESIPSAQLFDMVNKALKKSFFHITEELIQQAIKKGLDPATAEKIRRRFLTSTCHRPVCCTHERNYESESVVLSKHWHRFLKWSVKETEKVFLNAIFKPQRVFKLFFSGAEAWIEPDRIKYMEMVKSLTEAGRFILKMKLVVNADKPAITFYDKDKLQEDFKTDLPLLKVELNEAIKIVVNKRFRKLIRPREEKECCLDNTNNFCVEYLSLYHFFRNVSLSESPLLKTTIRVKVCGLKNFVVQNDESVMDVNSTVHPFGTRPEIIDFDIKNLPPYDETSLPFITNLNLIGPNFYIGSKEVFCKKWDAVYVNLNWKDKPTDFRNYYQGYLKDAGGLFGLDQLKFLVNLSVLENGEWKKEKTHAVPFTAELQIKGVTYHDRRLFDDNFNAPFCAAPDPLSQTLFIRNSFFDLQQQYRINKEKLTRYTVESANGFLKLNLQLQDFCHKVYAYVLARQMMALGKLPDDKIEEAIYYDSTNGNLIVFSTDDIEAQLLLARGLADRVNDDINNPGGIRSRIGNPGDGEILTGNAEEIRRIVYPDSGPPPTMPGGRNLSGVANNLENIITDISNLISNSDDYQAIIPNEPWTPIINGMSIDYMATATLSDIDFIHLYPYKGTYKHEEIELEPALLPTFCDEGNLFIGLEKLVPGSNLNMLFQLAEATADSESEREEITWYYLDNNAWLPLRNGFNVIDDATNGLTTTGIIRFAMPERMSNENSILPAGIHWIKAAIGKNSRSVSETVGIHTQAIQALFTNEAANDKMRLAQPLPAESIAKLKDADTAVKKVTQLYESFGGRIPEIEGQYYVRVSEHLRHKGRAIQKFDYERLVLEAFPQLLKAKCINHSYALNARQYKNDFPVAPGYVLLAVLPDLNKLKAPQSLEPRVPVSLLEKIEEYLSKRTSPFVRLRAMNARYEKVNFCLTVKLFPGKDENYYKEKLQQDIREFLAPWAIGQYDLLTFGQSINRSDIIRFLETRDYLDYLLELKMQHEADGSPLSTIVEIAPKTPRSILIAGHVEVCTRQGDCEKWDERDKCTNRPEVIVDYCKNDGPIIN